MTANELNAHFRKNGLPARIRRGAGYYYWLDSKNQNVPDAESVMVCSVDDISLDDWMSLASDVSQLCGCAAAS